MSGENWWTDSQLARELDARAERLRQLREDRPGWEVWVWPGLATWCATPVDRPVWAGSTAPLTAPSPELLLEAIDRWEVRHK
jgi:hypothetical protein